MGIKFDTKTVGQLNKEFTNILNDIRSLSGDMSQAYRLLGNNVRLLSNGAEADGGAGDLAQVSDAVLMLADKLNIEGKHLTNYIEAKVINYTEIDNKSADNLNKASSLLESLK